MSMFFTDFVEGLSMPAGRPQSADEQRQKRSKRDRLLDEAARTFNAEGVGQASLSEIGRRLGVTRSALYYYAEDREDLLFQCYRRACETQARDLEAVSKLKARPLARLLAFVSRSLDPERPEEAALCEIAVLPEAQRETIEGLRQANLARLIDIIEDGVRAHDIRPCKPRVVAEAISGILAWGPLAPRWSEEGAPAPDLVRIRDGAHEFLSRGLARDRKRADELPSTKLDLLRAPQGSLFDRANAAAMKTEELLRSASRLFNAKGVDAVSLDDIAAEIGATKGAVYHYLADKPALIARCYNRAWDLSERVFEIARAHNGDGLAQAILAYRLLAETNIHIEFSPLAPFVGLEALTANDRKSLRKRITKLENIYPDLAARGVADGSVRDIDLQAYAVVSAGTFGWLPKWAHQQDELSSDDIVEELTRLFTIGLAAR